MKGSMIRCVRCKGRKKIFKMNGAYSLINTGGVEIECPMCLGNGFTKSLAEALEEIKAKNSSIKGDRTIKRDFKHEEKTSTDTEQA